MSLGVPARPAAGELIVLTDSGEGRRVTIRRSLCRIGKSKDADLWLDDPHVSRAHAEVEVTGDGVILRDLGSRNGTFIGGMPIKEVVLTNGAIITVGETRIRFDAERRASDEPPPTSFGAAVGRSATMGQVFEILRKLAPSDVSVTLIGETGTGKDVLARALHAESPRGKGPFEVFDCGAVASNLIESELFGHEKGAFTGAVSERAGAFERADGGTLFLDEIGEMPLDLQPRLLRALEQREILRVGGGERRKVDVRVIAATNRDLSKEVDEGRFRQDLFFRLSGAVVEVPPLRARRDDLPVLAKYILADLGRGQVVISAATLEVLKSYDWPGNVRELRNVLESAAAFIDGPTLEPRNLMFFRKSKRAPTLDRLPLAGKSLEVIEKAAIKQTLEKEGGNKSKAARTLGIASSTLYEKLKKYGL